MEKIKRIENKLSKLFNGISEDEIRKVIDLYNSYSVSQLQSLEDSFYVFMRKVILKETNLNDDDLYENYDEIFEVMTNYNWESHYGLNNDKVDIIKLINNINKV